MHDGKLSDAVEGIDAYKLVEKAVKQFASQLKCGDVRRRSRATDVDFEREALEWGDIVDVRSSLRAKRVKVEDVPSVFGHTVYEVSGTPDGLYILPGALSDEVKSSSSTAAHITIRIYTN